MTLAEKIGELKIYSIGTTIFEEPEKKFFAHSYYDSAFEMAEDEEDFMDNNGYLKGEERLKVFYAPTVEEVVDKALEEEKKIFL